MALAVHMPILSEALSVSVSHSITTIGPMGHAYGKSSVSHFNGSLANSQRQGSLNNIADIVLYVCCLDINTSTVIVATASSYYYM